MKQSFFSSRDYSFIHTGELSLAVQAALERVLLAADVSIRRVRAPTSGFYPRDGFPDEFLFPFPGSSGEPVEVRGFFKAYPRKNGAAY